jgi:hypothetical protein
MSSPSSTSTTTTSSSSTISTSSITATTTSPVNRRFVVPLAYPFFSFGILIYLYLRLRFTKRRLPFGLNARMLRYEK